MISSKDIVVALESGKVLRSGDGGGTWEEIYYFKDAQVPFEILWAENKLIIATSKQVDGHESHNQNSHPRIQVHELVGDTLETLFDQTFPTIFYFTNLYSEARVEYISGSLFVFAPTKSAYRLDDNSGEWKVIDLPDFYGMSVSNDHQLIAIWTAKGAFSSVHYSSDLGESWIKLPSPPLLTTHVEMYSKTEGFLWSVKPGWYTSSYKHLRLNSAKNRWSSVGKAPVSCEAILMNPLAKEFYCVFPGGEIHTISDSTGYQ